MCVNKIMQSLRLGVALQLTANIGKIQSNVVNIDVAGTIRNLGALQLNAACNIKITVDKDIAAAADSQVALGFNLALFIVTVQQVGATAHVRAISQGVFHGADGDVTGFGLFSMQLISMCHALRGHCLGFIRNIVLIRYFGIKIAIVNTRNNNIGVFSIFAHGNQLAVDS